MSDFNIRTNNTNQNEKFGMENPNGAGNSTSSSPPNQMQRDAAIRQSVLQQMTEKERQALVAVREKVTVMRRIGAIGGALVTYGFLSRRKPLPSLGARVGLTILGSIAGGGVMMPLGVFWARKDMQNVEDPTHFAKVLQGAADERSGRIAPGMSQGISQGQQQQQQDGQSGSPSYPNLPPSQQSTRRARPTNSSNQWGDDSFDDSVLYGSQSQSTSYPSNANQTFNDQGMNNNSQSNSMPQQDNNQQEPQQQQQQSSSSSRWAQIRGDRAAQASSWERLRQQNAQEVYQKRNANSNNNTEGNEMNAGSSGFGGSGDNKGDPMADPTFGKSMSPARAQAQREYEASFERERRGIDG